MIELNDLINGNLKKDTTGINSVWGFYRFSGGDIKLNLITCPLKIGNMNFIIQRFYMDGFLYDNKYESIIPVQVELKSDEDRCKGKYNNTYFPVHEYYKIPRIHCTDEILNPYNGLNKKLYQFEKLINNFYVTQEEIEAVKEYIEKFLYNT